MKEETRKLCVRALLPPPFLSRPMRLTSAALVLAAACLLGLSAEAGKLRQRSKAFPIPDINDMEHVVFRKGAGTPCLVTEVVDQQDLNGAPLPAKHRFRVLRFDKVRVRGGRIRKKIIALG